MRYLAIDYVSKEKKDDLQHRRKTLRYLAIIEAALVDYITDKSGPVHSFETEKEGLDLGNDIKIM
jgi:hypothetical protein